MENPKSIEFLVTNDGLNPGEAVPYSLSAQILELILKHVLDVTRLPGYGLGGDIPIMIMIGKNNLSVRVGENENFQYSSK